MENNTYRINFNPAMLFDLCVNKTLTLCERAISNEDKEWFNAKILSCQGVIRHQLAHLLTDSPSCCDPLCFELVKEYKLHPALLPALIENALVAMISDLWLHDNGINSNLKDTALEELKSVALRKDKSLSRRCNY